MMLRIKFLKRLAKDVFEMFVNEEKVLTKSRVVEYIYQNLSFQFNKDVACVNFKDKQAVVTFYKSNLKSN